ncbi:lymphoid-specific helicase-like [Argiope bruennichi]|uniref:Proliferation-associated SNF2-like protein n=1 Tax=Argiope bruennichi TaxID=94029 RepID=A0A8T0E6U9_ARGBR|nr:lymphoid-specific helicase-like [Argiope bruennichi]XP_055935276.1 lymphoid-specific helicase-like [Argiope bruennichi]KAF8766652.1 Lymphoid-specific helicase like protein [Argiope bruennichi]
MEAQISSTSTLLENATYDGNFLVNGDSVITEKMLLEERMLEEKTVSEEQELRKQVLEAKKKEEEETCFKRLHLLLSRSSIYAKFMADKLKKHEEETKKKTDKEQDKLKNSVVENGGTSKRKAAFSSAKKKAKTNQNIANFFKTQKGNAKPLEENYQNGDEDPSKLSLLERQPKLLTGGIMREYQIDGYEWLKTLFENGVNGILADEMGLGKTIQCIAFIAYLVEMGVSGPFFVCGPLCTVPNWYAEFKRFAPDVPVMIYHGDKNEREELRQKITKKVRHKDVYCFPVVITSYQIALIDAAKIASFEWKMLVIDEAHRIKNFQCKLIGSLKKYNAVHRLLLTGTPLQNNLTELWSLLNFILPEIFDDLQIFHSWFDISRLAENGATQEIIAQEQEKQIVSKIHQILTPFLLRRTKSDVELTLPPKKTVVVRAPMTELQQKYYTGVLNYSIKHLLKGHKKEDELIITDQGRHKRKSTKTVFYGEEDLDLDELFKIETKENVSSLVHNGKNNKLVGKENLLSETLNEGETMSEINLKLTNLSMCLRKICCHPYLISYPLDPRTNDYLVDENIVKSSGKLLVLDILLPQLKERGHKILLFSQFVSMLEILEDYCTFRKFKYTKLYGSMDLAERQEQLKAFNEDESIFIFLISTKAGGLGINLTAADTVILYDTDWNPQGDLQAQDRCHRIGQTKPVIVYHLVIPNTYDERVFKYAATKRKLEKVIIQKGRFNSKDGLIRQQHAITKEELLELLESSDANGFVNAANFVIPPKELESILDRSDMIAKADM